MTLDSTSVQAIIRAGASVTVSSKDFDATSLQAMARVAKEAGTTLTVKVNSNLNSTSLQGIAKAGGGRVVIDLTAI